MVRNYANPRVQAIFPLCDGVRSSHDIAAITGDNAKYVQRIMLRYNLPRLKQAPPPGRRNPAYKSGRKIDRDGYVLVSAPPGHPFSRKRKGRTYGIMYEHRLVMERQLGRYLDRLEIVDHVDGLRLHNDPSNLRLFCSNAEHLKATITDRVPQWSEEGKSHIGQDRFDPLKHQPVRTYDRMKKSGDARLREILLAMLKLGEDSPFLLGTHHHLEKAGIVDFSRSSLIHELDLLSQRYA